MQTYLKSQNILQEQAGSRHYRSTERQTAHLFQIEDAFQAKKVVPTTFNDMQNAFDKLLKDGLFVKIIRSGINGKMCK